MSLFEELLGKHRGHARGHHGNRRSLDWGDGRRPSQAYAQSFPHAAPLLAQALRSKTVIVAVVLFAAVFLAAAIGVLAFLLPFISQQLGFIGENGIKGLLDQLAPTLKLLWNGAGK